ncbi:basic helix-loop-helix (bHLH) DNA-binding superfamily protein [Euphorbia peplus]|nr:basic helix-loop-helix (bHLH) DNA-binding superfamily protein [Euphorbia peplus]
MEELNEDGFLEELQNWESIPNFESEEMFQEFSVERDFNNYYFLNSPFVHQFSPPFTTPDFHFTDSSFNALLTPPFRVPSPKIEEDPIQPPLLNSRGKKFAGQPSKNLMAERRRRKRLNDRLSMLRSIVPNISKMDRTSIVGDTIEYVKELLDKINNLQQEINVPSFSNDHMMMPPIFKDAKPTQFMLRNSPKIDVERRKEGTQIEMRCSAKPGLLLSTLSTLEALGLEIQHCVISCFNDFALQASCSQELDHRKLLQSCEDVKQALFTTAGYGGR